MGDWVLGPTVPLDPSWMTAEQRVTRTVTGSTTVTASDMMIAANATTAALTVQLPKAADYGSHRLDVKRDNPDGFDVTVMPASGETIDGLPMVILTGTVRASVGLVPIGTGWRIV